MTFVLPAMMPQFGPRVIISILVIFHRCILAFLVVTVIRILLTVGLLKIKIKAGQNHPHRTTGSQSGRSGARVNGISRKKDEQDRLDVQISPLCMLLGRRIGAESGLCCIRSELSTRLSGGSASIPFEDVSATASTTTGDNNNSNANGAGKNRGYDVRSITSVQVRKLRIGSVGVSLFPALKNYDNGSGIGSDCGRCCVGLSFGNLQLDARARVVLDGTSTSAASRGHECSKDGGFHNGFRNGAGDMERGSTSGTSDDDQGLAMTLDIAFRVDCFRLFLVPMSRIRSLLFDGFIRSKGNAFDAASSVRCSTVPALSLSGGSVTTCAKVACHDPITASISLESFLAQRTELPSTGELVGSCDDTSTAARHSLNGKVQVAVGLQKLNLKVVAGDETSDLSASIDSMHISLSKDASSGLVQIEQSNRSSVEKTGRSVLGASVSLRALSAIVCPANQTKVILHALVSIMKLKKEERASTSSKNRDRKPDLLLGDGFARLGFKVSIFDDITIASEAKAAVQALSFGSAEVDIDCCLLSRDDFSKVRVKPVYCIRASTRDIIVDQSAELSLKREEDAPMLRISNADLEYIHGINGGGEKKNNAMEVILGSFNVNANDAQIVLLSRINGIAKNKPKKVPSFILELSTKKKLSMKSKPNARRVKLSCSKFLMFVDGCSVADGFAANRAKYAVVSNNIGVDFTPKDSDGDRDSVDARASKFHASVTVAPHLILPLHPDVDRGTTPSDVDSQMDAEPGTLRATHKLNQRPVTFTMATSGTRLRAFLGSASHRKERDRIKDDEEQQLPSPHEEIDLYAETMSLRESFGDSSLLPVAAVFDAVKGTSIVEATRVTVSVVSTRYEEGDDYPRCLVRNVCINTHGPTVRGRWSPILQQYIALIEQTTKRMIKRYQNMYKTGPRKSKTVDIVNVMLRVTKSLLDIRLHMGRKSVLDLAATSFSIDVMNNPRGLWKKPTIRIVGKGLSGHLNDFEQQVFSLDELRFEDVLRHATSDELATYQAKINGEPHEERNALVSDINGRPLLNGIGLHLGGTLRIIVPPVLHLGEVIEDVSINAKTMFMALRQAGLHKPPAPRKYQLMTIAASIPFADGSLLEPLKEGNGLAANESAECFDMLRLSIEGLNLSVERLTPPSCTQTRLNELDEDKRRQYDYGPVVQGGDTLLTIRHAVCLLHPLTIATPLAVLDDFAYAGLFMLAGLDPNTPGLVERPPFGFLFSCHHKTVAELSSPNVLPSHSPCGCQYGVTLTSCSANPKMFFDGAMSCAGMDGSYGMVVLDSLPALMEIIKRLQPPPSPTSAPAGQIGWWDNLRFLIHGDVRLCVERLCFRFLLDTPARYDWSILLQCRDYVFDHSTGGLDVSMTDATLTVPGLPYHLTQINQDVAIDEDITAACGLDSKGGRHSLLLVPHLEARVAFDWIVRCPRKAKSTDHHSPYLVCDSLSTFLSDDDFAAIAVDKFYSFKSLGVNLDVSLKLTTSDSFNTWLALRVDVLPWLTHKIISAIPPPSENEADGPGPLPIVEKLLVEAQAESIHMACWFDDDDGDKSNCNGVSGAAERNGGICVMIPSVKVQAANVGKHHIRIEGLIQAALLDIDYNSSNGTKPVHNLSTKADERVLVGCDEIVGSFGVTREATRSAETTLQKDWNVSLDANGRNDPQAQPECAAHSIFYHLQQWSRNITDLDSVLLMDHIDILSSPLADLMVENSHLQYKSTHNDTPANMKQNALWHESQMPWTVLVGGLKILWTLDIRDALLSLSQDLRLTLDYMKLSLRQTLPSTKGNNDTNEGGAAAETNEARDNNMHTCYSSDFDSNDDVDDDYDDTDHQSSLGYLLKEKSLPSSTVGSPLLEKPALSRSTSVQQARQLAGSNGKEDTKIAQNTTMPTLDVHLSNPQIQLHSDQTGGSVILAMRGAYIDGKRYLSLIDPENVGGLQSSTSIESLLMKTEFQYRLEKMEIYAITPGVDVDAGLQWLDFHSDESGGRERCDSDDPGEEAYADELPSILPSMSLQRGIPESSSEAKVTSRRQFQSQFSHYNPKAFRKAPLLQLIMKRCTFDSRQIFHRHPHHLSSEEIAAYVRRGLLEPLHEAALDQVDLHIDEMSFMLDAHQYITTFDLIRNVLLEPPKTSSRREKRLFADPNAASLDQEENSPVTTTFEDEAENDDTAHAKVEAVVRDWNTRFPRPRDGSSRQRKRIRQQLRAASQEFMAPLEQQHLLSRNNSSRRIKYTLGKLKWEIRSQDYLDEVTIDFTGFRGQHEFIVDGAVISNISLEDVQALTARPGPDALAFYDPNIILACEVQGENPCTRCGKHFNRATNEARSCVHHAGSYVFGSDGMQYWTCCASRLKDAPGCVARPHSGREKAAVIRIETLPSTVQGLRMYKHVEINFYPNVQHTFVVQITKDRAKLFMAYFLGADDSQPLDDDVFDGDSDDDIEENSILLAPSEDLDTEESSTCPSPTLRSSSARRAPQNPTSSSAGSKKRPAFRRRSGLLGSNRDDRAGNEKSASRTGGKRTRLNTKDDVIVEGVPAAGASPRLPQEIGFIKFWRIGHIHASISVSGFAIVTNDLTILIPAFSKAYKVGRANYLGQKYVSHLIHEVVRSAASSSMQKMKSKFSRHGRSKSSIDEEKTSNVVESARGGTLEAARADLLLGSGGRKPPRARSNRTRIYTT